MINEIYNEIPISLLFFNFSLNLKLNNFYLKLLKLNFYYILLLKALNHVYIKIEL